MGRQSATSLAPGFRFHPTDEELVRYYLKRKVCGKSLRFDAISEIDIYKTEPWDLPHLSRLKTRDLEWYFFSFLDKKYGNGSKTNRATEKGYWKTTGKDRPIYHYSRIVGMKKTLVYHHGRAPRGQRSNWVMHEYRLVDEELEKAGVGKDAFVLCRIFQKSGTGPKNGERYGAPLIEEEWEDEDDVIVPGEHAADEVVVGDEPYAESDVEQNVGSSISPENAPVPSNFYYGDTSNHVEVSFENPPPSFDYYGDASDYVEDPSNLFIDEAKPFIGDAKDFDETNVVDDQQFFALPEQYEENANPVKVEDFIETTNEMNPMEASYQLYEPPFGAMDNQPSNKGLFLETNDLACPVDLDPSSFDMLDEYLAYFNEDGNKLHYMPPESLGTLASETKVLNEESTSAKCADEELMQLATTSKKLSQSDDHDAGSSSNHQIPEDAVFESDVKYPFLKKATRMLGNFPAPPAFAADYPSKGKALRLGSAAQSPSSIRVTAGIVQIRNTVSIGNWVNLSYDKTGNLQLTISITLPPSDTNTTTSDILTNFLSCKAVSAMSWSWFFLMLFWVLILPMSYKLGSYIYAK